MKKKDFKNWLIDNQKNYTYYDLGNAVLDWLEFPRGCQSDLIDEDYDIYDDYLSYAEEVWDWLKGGFN